MIDTKKVRIFIDQSDPISLIINGLCDEIDRVRHEANEWADMAANGIQCLRNIQDGVSTPVEALQEMESNLIRILAISNVK